MGMWTIAGFFPHEKNDCKQKNVDVLSDVDDFPLVKKETAMSVAANVQFI